MHGKREEILETLVHLRQSEKDTFSGKIAAGLQECAMHKPLGVE